MAYRAIRGNIRKFGFAVSFIVRHLRKEPVAIQASAHLERLEPLWLDFRGLGYVTVANRTSRLDFLR